MPELKIFARKFRTVKTRIASNLYLIASLARCWETINSMKPNGIMISLDHMNYCNRMFSEEEEQIVTCPKVKSFTSHKIQKGRLILGPGMKSNNEHFEKSSIYIGDVLKHVRVEVRMLVAWRLRSSPKTYATPRQWPNSERNNTMASNLWIRMDEWLYNLVHQWPSHLHVEQISLAQRSFVPKFVLQALRYPLRVRYRYQGQWRGPYVTMIDMSDRDFEIK